MKKNLFILAVAFLAQQACRPALPDEVPWPTKICVRTQHHTLPIPQTTVYIKYHTDTFPGYDKPASYYNKSFITGSDGRGCLESIPEGNHWIVGIGYDSLYYPHDVRGSMKVVISLDHKPVLDTILYVSE